MALDETAKTGNIDQVIPNLKACVPFLYTTSRQSKYMYEFIDFIHKVQYTLSPFMKIRVLEFCFVNTKGGERGNVEADLVQEHSVRAQKTLIRQLGANKTEKAILRSASAGVVVDSVCRQLDTALNIKPKSSRHTKTVSAEDKEKILQILKTTKPFTLQPGRDMKESTKILAVQPIAFYAYMSGNLNNPGGHNTLISDTVKTNQGLGYHPLVGVFIVPKSGTYFFTWTMSLQASSYHSAELVVNNVANGAIYIHTSSDQRDSATGNLILSVNEGDEVYFRTKNNFNSGGIISDAYGRTDFSGFLIE
ncbi:uncharacterized protein LOC133193276 [Saccostrea echinata]|uniref:uncharacterized protein LOC133193276 n=1 Tax=Saccostrea echinata TaxID=191078 RepID=UPI002A80F3D9|nr:uncharacterized protein LOC133193276 [Saccostrea echinata]